MELATQTENISQAFAQLADRDHGAGQALKSLRQRAFDRFEDLGWPTTKDETWRFTNPKAIAKTAFQLPHGDAAPAADDSWQNYLAKEASACLVFVDGVFHPERSRMETLPTGCQFLRLNDALDQHEAEVTRALQSFQAHAAQFGSLNTAFWEDGALLVIDDNAQLEKPLQILYVQNQQEQPVMIHPRVIVKAGKNSNGKLVETYVGPQDAAYWMNNVTQIQLADGAHFTHYLAQFDGSQALHTANLNATLMRNSNLTCHHMLMGAKLMRNNLNVHLRGEGGSCTINGLTLGHDDQVLDNHVEMNHVVPHCHSSQHFKTILDDKAHGIFGGRVVVFQEAQKTDAQQANHNLLLSDHARIDTKPQLEIYADDVKCAHGATTGQLDKDALFYLATRGLDPKTAREVLLYAFAHEVIDRLDLPSVLDQVEQVLLSRFSSPNQLFGG